LLKLAKKALSWFCESKGLLPNDCFFEAAKYSG
jgi:hypothetical protein